MRVGSPGVWSFWWSTWIEPVSQLIATLPQPLRACNAGDQIDPVPHAIELCSQNARVAVALVQHPRNNDRRISPSGGGRVLQSKNIRNNKGNDSLLLLLKGKIS